MDGNITLDAEGGNVTMQGWTFSPDGRGTIDILISCLFTIFLCCWTSVCPNIPAKTDNKWRRLQDKFSLACIGLLGPEFLLMLALGQWASARRSVKKFQAAGYTDWTMAHAFFCDMGGFLLQAPGYPEFPIDAEQLYYLVTKNYIEYPDFHREDIQDKNKADGLARFITIAQALWFTASCIARPVQGLAITTFEITALSFIIVFFAISFCWLHKPLDVSRAVTLTMDVKIETILAEGPPSALEPWHHTPLDCLSRKEWFCSIVWAYGMEVMRKTRIPIHLLFTRPVTTKPYNRIPSDNFPVTDVAAEAICTPFIIGYSCTFILAWNFDFPSPAEQLLWRISSIYMLVFCVAGGLYAGFCHWFLIPKNTTLSKSTSGSDISLQDTLLPTHHIAVEPLVKTRIQKLAAEMRNVSPDKDPHMEVPLKVLIPNLCICVFYCVFRAYILLEDYVGLRRLPESAFGTVQWSNWFPHI